MMRPDVLLLGVLIGLATTAAGQSSPPTLRELPKFPAAEADVELNGRCVFEGELPPPQYLSIHGKPCEAYYKDKKPLHPAWEIDKSTNGIAHCLVSVEGAERRWQFDVPREVVLLDQIHCRFVPHVFGVMVGQTLRITSSDDKTYHNVHYFGKNRTTFGNISVSKGQIVETTFEQPEHAQYRCDMHPWMHAHVHVLRHPLFAVTDPRGRFSLPKLPSGTYALTAWHERWKSVARVTVAIEDGKLTSVAEVPIAGAGAKPVGDAAKPAAADEPGGPPPRVARATGPRIVFRFRAPPPRGRK